MNSEPWCIVDTETSGLSLPIYTVEIAAQKMRGWEKDGEPFRVFLNHNVPIEPMAEAVHGYSQEFLKKEGLDPFEAHGLFKAYVSDLPLVSYNLSFDWNRVLEPEYTRLNISPAGRRGFCAMTLTRRVIKDVPNYRLETLKDHFQLSKNRSHRGRQDVETLFELMTNVMALRLYTAGIIGFEKVQEFSTKKPLSACLETINGNEEACWYIFDDASNDSKGPFKTQFIREICKSFNPYVWREGMVDWALAGSIPDFELKNVPSAAPPKKRLVRQKRKKVSAKSGSKDVASDVKEWIDQFRGLCMGIVADRNIDTSEIVALQNWILGCPYPHIYPISKIAEVVENIFEDGSVSNEEIKTLLRELDMIS